MKTILKVTVAELARLINELGENETLCFAEDYEGNEAQAWHTATRTPIRGISSRQGVLVYYNTTSAQRALMAVEDIDAQTLADYLEFNNSLGGAFDIDTPIFVEVYIG